MENNQTNSQNGSQKYWLSLEQWRKDPQFAELAEREFMSSPLQSEDGKDGWARREFLKLMGASLALTSFGCMRRPAQMIVPYAKKPKEITHGLANYYASSFVDGSEGFGILVTSRDGRPVKIEGNPDHPANRGGMSARAHAHILSLYDPERLAGPQKNLFNDKKTSHEVVKVKYEDLDKAVVEKLKKGGVAILSGSLKSPSTELMFKDFSDTFGAKVFYWDAQTTDDLAQAAKLSYGKEVVPHYRFDKAKVIVSINCDFLGTHMAPTEFAKAFVGGRKPGKDMNKLVVFESLLSLTGSNADERYRIGAAQQLDVVMGLLHTLLVTKKVSRFASDSAVLKALEPYASSAANLGLPEGRLKEIAEELWASRGQSLVVSGGWAQGENTLALQVATNLLNSVLENDGRTIDYVKSVYGGYQGSNQDLTKLIEGLNQGQIKTVIIHRCNPGYAAGAKFTEALKKAGTVIYTGDRADETGVMADYIVPDHHPLENWDDSEIQSGLYTIQQPTIQPLYDTRAFQDSLLVWSKAGGSKSSRITTAQTWYEYLRLNWKSSIYSANRGKDLAKDEFDDFWVALLHKGVFQTGSDRDGSSAARNFSTAALANFPRPAKASGYELVLYSTVGLRDGSMANVAWLQEFPDPVTKICWDNYLCVSPKDAAREKLAEGDVVTLKANGRELKAPVHIQPGQADGVLGLAVGYGRTKAGKVANGVGVNAYEFVNWKDGRALAFGLAAEISKTGANSRLACVQDHHSMEGRQIVVEATLADFMKDPNANIHRHKMMTMWSEHKYPNNKWGMVIDLNTCTGCGSCIVACQSENNIPTVGKKYVLEGREMHWIRLDRYYTGNPEDPGVVNQPIVCMHCDNAPCETVCPVMATVHSDEGTNDMIYNRCVGTRYCSNNCPYKVRRFNWFNNAKNIEKPLNYAMNPDVTVRARGVMEKCTFCIHRIRGVKSQARLHDRILKDGDIKTACQQSCPTNAIVFGDLNDPESQVRKVFDEKNAYALLEELNAKPAVHYRSKIRNTAELKGDHGHGHSGSAHEGGQHS